jgi:hypothetical protein
MTMHALHAGAFKWDMGGSTSGVFGRLLPPSKQIPPSDSVLDDLAGRMRATGSDTLDAAVPAAETFFGQFIDHDITFDTTSQFNRAATPETIENVRTPKLELDSCYADGPEGSPYLYDHAPGRDGHYFLIGNPLTVVRKDENGNETEYPPNDLDLPRNIEGRALIGDPRNDENLLVSQFHMHVLLFHNAVMQLADDGKLDDHRMTNCDALGQPYPESDFQMAQRLVRWHYQWLVNYSFLPAFVDADIYARCWERTRDGISRVGKVDFARAAMPVEFSVAAFRFAHSTVRSRYRLNADIENNLFANPGQGGFTSFEPTSPDHVIDWRYLAPMDSSIEWQKAARLDTEMASELYGLPFDTSNPNLALRNLRRGATTFRLPSGEAVAHAMGFRPLPQHQNAKDAGLPEGETPLWFYCLQEAEANEGKLGDVGGTIVAMVLLRMQRNDPESYLYNDERWTPIAQLNAKQGGLPEERFTLGDFMSISSEEAKKHGTIPGT